MSMTTIGPNGPVQIYTQPEWNAWEQALREFIRMYGPAEIRITAKNARDAYSTFTVQTSLDASGNVVCHTPSGTHYFQNLRTETAEFIPPERVEFLQPVATCMSSHLEVTGRIAQQMTEWSQALGYTFAELQRQAQQNRMHAEQLGQREVSLAYREGMAGAAAEKYVSDAHAAHAYNRVTELDALNQQAASVRIRDAEVQARLETGEAYLYTVDADRRAEMIRQHAQLRSDDAGQRVQMAALAASLDVNDALRRSDLRG
ncbi:hypothetical protein ABB37_10121, partial [Leptomonas pyrrhocoris]